MNKFSMSAASRCLTIGVATAAFGLMSAHSASASTLNLNFTQLSGVTGGTPALTGVYRADLSGIGFDLSSILISDSNSGVGGSSGRFSGFDLDGIKLSRTLITNAADIAGLPSLNVFNFAPSGTIFTPGTQRSPADPVLFGTSGGNINNAVATLQSFDANATTNASAFGFASLGDGGQVGFNLTSLVSTNEPLYLYIGEAGDNGEVVKGQITVSDQPIQVPEPSGLAALSLMGIYFTVRRSQKTKAA